MLIRMLMAVMFIESAIDKSLHWHFYLQETTQQGIPFPALALAMAIAVEVLGSIALLTRFQLPLAALMLAGYVFVLNFFYFDFWNLSGQEAIGLRKEFLKNLAVVAGLLAFILVHRRDQQQDTI
ncbi:DoxX family protein [Methylobacillus glycogenes]|uniref:DoxX family protein n=1 Tax=Methylobacillus glycogenes TaxID=406 RepID=UPI001F16CCCE|nr:DoxX family protein [Methylobacillus glycogenes]